MLRSYHTTEEYTKCRQISSLHIYRQNIPKSTGLFVNKQKCYLGRLHKINMTENGWKLDLHGSLHCLQSEKIISKTNSTFSVMNIPPYSMLWTLCGKLISAKSFLRSATQLKQNIWMKPMKFNQHGDIK